jgi:hypothetical protein
MSLIIDSEPKKDTDVTRGDVVYSNVGKTVFEILAGNSNLEGSEEFSEEFVMSVTRNGNHTVPDESTPPPSRPIHRPSPPPIKPGK